MKELQIYVAPWGSDQHNGTKEAPLASLEAAVGVIKRTLPSTAVIYIREGIYYFSKPLELNEETVGSRNIKILISGYRDENVIITGAQTIKPQWKVYKDKILVSDIGAGRRADAFYVDGQRQIMARYPNYKEGEVLGGYSEDAISRERVSRWKNPRGGYIRALHHAEWGGNSYRITGKTSENELLYEWVGDNNRGSDMHAIKRMVENIFEELDAPGEWFYDKDSGKLYFYPPDETAIHKAVCELVTTEEFIRISGNSLEFPMENIEFKGITFKCSHRTMFTKSYERPLRGDWGFVRSGTILMENTEKIRILRCTFKDIGGNAIIMSGYNADNEVKDSDFIHIGATGVLIAGKQEAVRDPSTYDGENHKTKITDFKTGPASEHYPRNILVESNYFYDIGVYEKQTSAVCMSVSESVTVKKNTIHHTSRAGINIHDGTFGGHIIEGNDLFDCVTETADHGPINCWGRDRYWSVPQHDAMGYFGRDKRAFALLDACKTTIIRGNRVYASYAFGIDIDDGASNYDIYNNLCIGVGIKLRDGFDRKVHNNVLIGSNLEHHMSFAYNNDLIYCNIICSPKICNTVCINEGATTFYSFNTYWNMGKEISALPEPDYKSITADPLFSSFEEGCYQVEEASPALAQGFVNFPMSDKDFGRADAPKPPLYIYTGNMDEAKSYRFYDVLLSDISGEGMRSAAGLPDMKGVFILERDVLGLFCKLGLPIGAGDVVRSIGDKKISNINDFLQTFDEVPLNVPTSIEIYRSQKPMKLTFIKQTEDFTSITEEAEKEWKKQA